MVQKTVHLHDDLHNAIQSINAGPNGNAHRMELYISTSNMLSTKKGIQNYALVVQV